MKIYRFLIIFFVAATTLLVSCEEYEDTVVPGPAADVVAAVGFAADNPTQWEFEPTVVDFDITVTRSSSISSSALEVPISVVTDSTESFIVPSKVSFAAGDSTAILTIAINYDNAVAGVDLEIGVKVGDDYLNPYSAVYGKYYGIVAILDWQKHSTGDYYSAYYDATWTQDLYNAAGTDKYRFFDLYTADHHLSFSWDGGNAITFPYETDANGYHMWMPGFDYGGYGPITVLWDSSPSWTFYDEATKEFQFEGKWTVAAGSLGWLDDYYTITTEY